TVTGPTGTATFTTSAGELVTQLVQQINTANLGINASINNIGQFQLTTQNNGSGQSVKITATAGSDISTPLGLSKVTVTVLDRGLLPSATIKVATPLVNTATEVMGSFAGAGPPPPLTQTTNSNQFFFQGANQALQNQLMSALASTSSLNTGAATTFTVGAG